MVIFSKANGEITSYSAKVH